jgi:opacity protein-like surface antigen
VGVLASGRTGRYVYRQHRAPRRHLAGWNVQISPKYVVGVEGDFAYANETATFHGSSYPANLLFGAPSLPFGASPNDAFHVRTTWDGSARLRFGWLINPSTMLYLTGGLAWAHLEAMSSCSPVPTSRRLTSSTPLRSLAGRPAAALTYRWDLNGWSRSISLLRLRVSDWCRRFQLHGRASLQRLSCFEQPADGFLSADAGAAQFRDRAGI